MKRRELRRALRTAAASRTPTPSPDLWAIVRGRLAGGEPIDRLPSERPRRRSSDQSRRVVAWLAAAAIGLAALVLSTRDLPPSHNLELGTAAPVPPSSTPRVAPFPTRTPRGETSRPGPSATWTDAAPGSRPVRTPSSTPAATPPHTPTAVPSGLPTPSPPEEPAHGYAGPAEGHTMELWARMEGTVVTVYWSVFDRDTFDSYVVLRSWHPRVPTWPADDHTEVIRRLRHDEGHSITDEGPWTERPVYRVVALRADDSEAGRSRAVVAEESAEHGQGGGGRVPGRFGTNEAVDVAAGRDENRG